MPKHKNPPLKERVWVKISDWLLDFAESLPAAKRGVLAWLQDARHEPRLTANGRPSGVTLDLQCLWICEIVPIELFERQIPSILRMVQEHKTSRFLSFGTTQKDLLKTLQGFKEGVLGSSWHNIGVLDFDKVKDAEVDYVVLEIESLAGGHVAFYFRIIPKQSFRRKINSIIEREFPSYTVLFPPRTWKIFFKGWWGTRTIPGETKKQIELQNLLIRCKAAAAKHLRRYVSGLLFQPENILPSVELWIKEDNSKPLSDDERKPPFEAFWDSVGLPKSSWETYVEPSGAYSIVLPRGDFSDLPVKIVCEKLKVPKESGHSGIERQIEHHVNYWVPALLSLWCVRSIYRDLVDYSGIQRLRLFSKIKKIRAGTAFKWSGILFYIETQYRRLEKDFDLKTYPRDFALCGFPDFKRTLPSKYVSILRDDLIGNTKYFLHSLTEMVASTQRLLKTKIESHVISTNYWTQIAVVILAITTAFLSVLMVVTGALAINSKPKICDSHRFSWICERVEKLLVNE